MKLSHLGIAGALTASLMLANVSMHSTAWAADGSAVPFAPAAICR